MKLPGKVAATAFAAIATASQAANPLIGIWTAEPSWCEFKGEIGEHDPAPIRITETEIVGLENICRITSVKPLPTKGAWTVFERCEGDGGKYQAKEIFLLDRDGALHRFGDNGFMIRMTRCK